MSSTVTATRVPVANRFLLIGTLLLAVFAILAIFGRMLAPQDPDAQSTCSPSWRRPRPAALARHRRGRTENILSRIIAGTRITLVVALLPVGLAGIIGVTLGLLAGYFGGVLDRVLIGLCRPAADDPGPGAGYRHGHRGGCQPGRPDGRHYHNQLDPAAGPAGTRRCGNWREEDFISAAVALGMRPQRVVWRHVLPNAVSLIVIQLSLLAGQAVLVASALGFLGLGVQPPAPEWGSMLGASREYIEVAPHVVLAPGVAIALLVFAFNMLGDGLRDRWDPNQT